MVLHRSRRQGPLLPGDLTSSLHSRGGFRYPSPGRGNGDIRYSLHLRPHQTGIPDAAVHRFDFRLARNRSGRRRPDGIGLCDLLPLFGGLGVDAAVGPFGPGGRHAAGAAGSSVRRAAIAVFEQTDLFQHGVGLFAGLSGG